MEWELFTLFFFLEPCALSHLHTSLTLGAEMDFLDPAISDTDH